MHNKEIILSIIIPCFNSSKTLKEAVDSCFLQHLNDPFEIILVDDASTDNTKEIMIELASMHSEIRLFFHDKNKGGGATRNTAIKHSSSALIFCLDSDDILPEGTLLKMVMFMKEKGCDGVGINHSIKFINEDLHNVHHVDTFSFSGEKIPFESLLQKGGVLCPLYSTFMHSKASFEAVGGYPSDHGFDTQSFAWRFLGGGFTAYTCPDTSYYHRINSKPSYYIREAEAGKVNYNWQNIFFDHYLLFTTEAQKFIETFKCSDFTRSIFNELQDLPQVFREDYINYVGQNQKKEAPSAKKVYITRNSIYGIILRIKARFIKKIKVLHTVGMTRKWRVDLIVAFIALRIKKAFRANFNSINKSEEIIDIVIPTISKDFELLKLTLEGIRTYVAHPINKIYIVSQNEGIIKDFCTVNDCVFVDERSVLGYGPETIAYYSNGKNRSGWMFQQLIKLSGEQFIEKKNYLVVDSDTVLITPHLFIKNKKYIFFQSEEWHVPYFKAFKHIFGYDTQSKLSLIAHMMIFNTLLLKEMKDEIEARHALSWDKVFIYAIDQNEFSSISDYETYGNWILHTHPHTFDAHPFYNLPLDRNSIKKFSDLVILYSKKYRSLSFHHYHE